MNRPPLCTDDATTTTTTSAHRSSAMDLDRNWFANHPTRDWYLREPLQAEFEVLAAPGPDGSCTEFALMLGHLRRLADLPSAPPHTKIIVCVIQIEPGCRLRVPALHDPRTKRFSVVSADGDVVPPETLRAAALLATEASGASVARQEPADEVCTSCGRPEQTGDLTMIFAEPVVGTKSRCLLCSFHLVLGGQWPQAITVFVRRGDAFEDAAVQRSLRDMAALKAVAKTGQGLVDAVGALIQAKYPGASGAPIGRSRTDLLSEVQKHYPQLLAIVGEAGMSERYLMALGGPAAAFERAAEVFRQHCGGARTPSTPQRQSRTADVVGWIRAMAMLCGDIQATWDDVRHARGAGGARQGPLRRG